MAVAGGGGGLANASRSVGNGFVGILIVTESTTS